MRRVRSGAVFRLLEYPASLPNYFDPQFSPHPVVTVRSPSCQIDIGLNCRVPEVNQRRRHAYREERLGDAFQVCHAREVVHPALKSGKSVLGVGKSKRHAVHGFYNNLPDGRVAHLLIEPVTKNGLQQQFIREVSSYGGRNNRSIGCVRHETPFVDMDVAEVVGDSGVKSAKHQWLAGRLAKSKRESFACVSERRQQWRLGYRRGLPLFAELWSPAIAAVARLQIVRSRVLRWLQTRWLRHRYHGRAGFPPAAPRIARSTRRRRRSTLAVPRGRLHNVHGSTRAYSAASMALRS